MLLEDPGSKTVLDVYLPFGICRYLTFCSMLYNKEIETFGVLDSHIVHYPRVGRLSEKMVRFRCCEMSQRISFLFFVF